MSSRLLRPLSTSLRAAPRALHTSVRVRTPQRPPAPAPLEPLRMPADMPREDYAAPAAYTLSLMGRVIKYLVFGGLTIAVVSLASYEGTHLYVEHVALASPSRSGDEEAFGWADENQAWTGGERGGTDPRLGFRARHALRAAWIAWEWGAGDTASTIAKAAGHYAGNSSIHPELRRPASPGAGSVNTVDRGYQLADEYIEAAIAAARRRGFAFPPELDPTRPAGPPAHAAPEPVHADATALDLLMLKAGILERIGTRDAVSHARELYEQVLAARVGAGHDLPVPKARVMRLAHKLGDLAQRHGDAAEAEAWWAWGLARAGLDLSELKAGVVPPAPGTGSWWWPFGGSSKAAPSEPAPPPATATLHALPAPVLRAATNLLISASAADAQTATPAGLDAAAAVQALALSYLPHPKSVAVPSSSTGPAVLQDTWEQQRAALVTLHKASVSHARKDASADPLELASSAADAAEAVLSTLTPTLPTAFTAPSSNPLAQPARRLLRDTLSTAAEASFTRAALLERRASLVTSTEDKVHCLEHAGEAYERAMSLAAAESGTTDAKSKKEEDAVGRGEDWTRFWTGYVRANEKIMKLVSEGEKGKAAEKEGKDKGK